MNIWDRYIFNINIPGEDGGGSSPTTTQPPTTGATPPGGHEVTLPEPPSPPPTIPPSEPYIPPPVNGGFIDYDAVVKEGMTGEVVDKPLVTNAPTPNAVYNPPEPKPAGPTVTLSDGVQVAESDFNKLDTETQEVFKSQGYEAGVKYVEENHRKAIERARGDAKQAQFEYEDEVRVYQTAINQLEPYKVKVPLGHGEKSNYTYSYNINQYLLDAKSPSEALTTLRQAGFTDKQIQNAALENVQMANEARQMVERQYSKAGIAKYAGDLAADFIVPGYYTATNWNNMGAGGKALAIGLDIITIIPIAKAAGMGAREVATAGRMARLAGAAKGVGKELVAELRAPVDMIAHPVATAKGTFNSVRDLGETLLHPRKIPEAVLTTSNGTVRLRVTEATSATQAKEIRDTLMNLARKGEKPLVEVNGVKYELSQSPLMKELEGGLAHATPQGETFEKGLRVEAKEGMSQVEQGLFVSHEPLPRFTSSSAFGKTGEKPVIYITSPETAKKAVATDKIYAGTAEMEMKFPVGTKLPAPNQRLFTRVGPNLTRTEIWLEKPLTAKQIIKLKSLGIIEDLKAGFKPAISVSGKSGKLNAKNIRQLDEILRESGNEEVARVLMRNQERLMRAGVRSTGEIGRAYRTLQYNRELGRMNLSSRPRYSEHTPERTRLTARERPERITQRTTRQSLKVISQSRGERPTSDRNEITRLTHNANYPERHNPPPPDNRPPYRENPPDRRPPPPGKRPPSRENPPSRNPPPPIKPPPPFRRPPGREYPPKPPHTPGIQMGTKTEIEHEPLELARGSLAWEQGKLEVDAGHAGPEQVYYYAEPPDYEVKVSVGVPPTNFKHKGRTPKETIQTIGGNVKQRVTVDMGITRATATPDKKKITFTANKPHITERQRMPRSKTPRITPRMGRLR